MKNGLDLGESYLTDKACSRFLEYIYMDFMEPRIEKMKEAKAVSILVDASTDCSVRDLIAVYVRHLMEGKPVNTFIGVEELQHCNAQGYIIAIDKLLRTVGLNDWKSQTTGFGSDGAAVMVGSKSGVSIQLRNGGIPWLINIQCLAHGLELAAMDALKQDPAMLQLHELLHGLYKQYHYSPKAWRELQAVAEVLEVKVWKPTKLKGTRWLPHIKAALQALIKNYRPLTTHMQHTAQAGTASADMVGRATKASKLLTDHTQLLNIHFFLDVLDTLSGLSLALQKDSLTLPNLLHTFETSLLTLTSFKPEYGDHVADYLRQSTGGQFDGVALSNYTDEVPDNFTRSSAIILGSLHAAPAKRFQCLDTDAQLKAAAKLVDAREWPDGEEDLATFGMQEVKMLLQNFSAVLAESGCDIRKARREEWASLKIAVKRLPRANQGPGVWEEFLQDEDMLKDLRNILCLYEIILVLPLSTASCERGFSAMKRVKSDWRSKLNTSTLSKLMYISTEGPDLEIYNCMLVL